ncbi:MAG: biliverdin-producing heme oxygenase [Polyangiales bacterium]
MGKAGLQRASLVLRMETQLAHRRIEDAMDAWQPDRDLARYGLHLTRLAKAIPRLEAALQRALQGFAPALGDQIAWRSTALAADLRDLGLGALPCNTAPAGGPDLSYRSLPEVLGSLYVLEGSKLGAAVLRRRFTKGLGLTPPSACRFYGDAEHCAGRLSWPQFQSLLDTQLCLQSSRTQAAARARETFAWLQQQLFPAAERP